MALPKLATFITLLTTAASSGAAQSAVPRPEFDVTSVKPSAAGTRSSSLKTPPGTLDAKNVVLPLLTGRAYGVEGFQITGGPAWLGSDRYDVEAKSAGDANVKQVNAMLQSLLEDRFKLKVHRETREGSIFELIVAKGGSKLEPLKEGSCVALIPISPPAPPAPGQKPPCGVMRPGANGADRTMTIDAVGATMAVLTRTLTLIVGRPVYDKTGIAGPLDSLHLEYVREDLATAPSADAAGPSIFTALPEQLGLKLESAKGPVDVLVIDRIERPSGN